MQKRIQALVLQEWFCLLPGVQCTLIRMSPLAVLAQRNLPAAIINMETGDIIEIIV